MNATDAGILIVVIFGLVAIFAFLRFRKKVTVQIDAGNAKLNITAENDPPAGVPAHQLIAHNGNIAAKEHAAAVPESSASTITYLASNYGAQGQFFAPVQIGHGNLDEHSGE